MSCIKCTLKLEIARQQFSLTVYSYFRENNVQESRPYIGEHLSYRQNQGGKQFSSHDLHCSGVRLVFM